MYAARYRAFASIFALVASSILTITAGSSRCTWAESVVFQGIRIGPEAGWEGLDASTGREGGVSNSAAGTSIRDAEGGPALGATLQKEVDFSPAGDCYEVKITFELESIGLADDSSGGRSSGNIYFCFAGIGVDMRIYGDRIVLDPHMKQYQVVRFGQGPQELTFLVDIKRKWVRIRRNGTPVGLYRTSDLEARGIRITAMGSTDTPCEILVRKSEVRRHRRGRRFRAVAGRC